MEQTGLPVESVPRTGQTGLPVQQSQGGRRNPQGSAAAAADALGGTVVVEVVEVVEQSEPGALPGGRQGSSREPAESTQPLAGSFVLATPDVAAETFLAQLAG
jgi:hypothetical protein